MHADAAQRCGRHSGCAAQRGCRPHGPARLGRGQHFSTPALSLIAPALRNSLSSSAVMESGGHFSGFVVVYSSCGLPCCCKHTACLVARLSRCCKPRSCWPRFVRSLACGDGGLFTAPCSRRRTRQTRASRLRRGGSGPQGSRRQRLHDGRRWHGGRRQAGIDGNHQLQHWPVGARCYRHYGPCWRARSPSSPYA